MGILPTVNLAATGDNIVRLRRRSGLSVQDLQTAITRAHEQKLRDEEAARNGRC